MDLCSLCLEGRIGGGCPMVLQFNVQGFNHMHLSYFSPQQAALGRCLDLCLEMYIHVNEKNFITPNLKPKIPNQTQRTGGQHCN